MRKLLTGAVIASATLALTGGAIAQVSNQDGTSTFDATLSPAKVGTKKKPRSGRLELNAQTNRESKSTASKIEIWIPKGAKLNTTGLKACSFGKANASGKAACPKASKAGSGEADALLNPYATNPAPIKFIVTAFNGGKLNSTDAATLKQQFPNSGSLYKKGRQYLVFHLQSDSPEVDQALAGVITSVSTKLYAQKLTIDIAPNLQQPATNVYSSLQRLETSIGLKSGKHMLMALTDCPKARENQFQLRLTFVPNPTPPANSTATAIDGARCSG